MALDNATSALLAQMAESGAPPLWELTPEQAREMGLALKQMYGPGPDMQRVQELTIGLEFVAHSVRDIFGKVQAR